MNKTFIFQTGHGKGIAKAEIEALLGECITDDVFDGFVVTPKNEVNVQDLQNRMGGIVRITEVLHSGPARMPLNFTEWVVKAVKEGVDASGKVRFGLSVHPRSEKILKKTLNDAKRDLKKEIGNCRYVNKDNQNLSSVQAWHQKLLKPGAIELHLFKSKERWYISKTLTIQDFEWYSTRDYDRPARDAANGMFPPKLAQTLINLSQPEEGSTIFDPFCGSGTVIMEAQLMGIEAWGSDLNPEMAQATKENCEWLEENHINRFNIPTSGMFGRATMTADATKLKAGENIPKAPYSIVTETWLGPALKKVPTELERPKLQREIEALYEAFFNNMAEQIKEPVTMVFTAAYYRTNQDRFFLPNLPAILQKYCEIVPLSDHERPSMFYERKHQIVGREIWKVRIMPA